MTKSNSDIQAQLLADDDIGDCEFIDITPNSNDIPNGFQAYIKHNKEFWCAYIKFPNDHPDFLSEKSIDDTIDTYSPHGDWTCCWLPLPISEPNYLVFGIDFSHTNLNDWTTLFNFNDHAIYRDRDYATNEILRLLHIAIQRYNP